MRATEKADCVLESVADNARAAVSVLRRGRLDRALEAVEDERVAVDPDLERFIVAIAAGLALAKLSAPLPRDGSPCRLAGLRRIVIEYLTRILERRFQIFARRRRA